MKDIREGILKIISDNGVVFTWDEEKTDQILTYLKANGVVRLVENQELPYCHTFFDGSYNTKTNTFGCRFDLMESVCPLLKTSFKRVEELI